jgi:hypothetical protein
MSLIITFMFEPAKLQMNWANANGTRTRRIAPDGWPTAGASATTAPIARPAPTARHVLAPWSTGLARVVRSRMIPRGWSREVDAGGTPRERDVNVERRAGLVDEVHVP